MIKTLGVYTKDFALYHDLIKVLKRRDIPYVSLVSPRDIPSRIGVVLTSHRELHDIRYQKTIAADVYDSVDHAIDLALQMLKGKEMYTEVFIGIDPGERPGVALIGDGIILHKTQVDSPDKVLPLLRRYIKDCPSHQTIIRIGHGSVLIRNRIINSLISLRIPIEIVDESKTTTSQQVKRPERDSEAAAAIALLQGGKIQSKLPLKPTKGAIKDLQRYSRQLTDGRYTISEKTALDVLHGRLTLREAIEKKTTSKKHKGL
ncbi:MAG: hypothetical protein QXS02_00080 [Candidatus Thermoplasmatota archaeon]